MRILARAHASAAMRSRLLARATTAADVPQMPTEPSGLIWQSNYEGLTNLAVVNGTGSWKVEQDPDVLGVQAEDRMRIVENAALPGVGQNWRPTGRGMRVELRPYNNANNFDVIAAADATASATTLMVVDPLQLAVDAWMTNDRTGELLRVRSVNGTTIGIARARTGGSAAAAILTGDTFTVPAGDVNDSGGNEYATSRAEAYGDTNHLYAYGQWRWVGFSVFIPGAASGAEEFVTSSSNWLSITQFKGNRGGSPPLAVEIDGSNFELGSAAFGTAARSMGGINKGNWTRFEIGMFQNTSITEGKVHVWKNRTEIIPPTSQRTIQIVSGTNDTIYLKQGIYRTKAWTNTHVVYFGPTKIGWTRSDVTP